MVILRKLKDVKIKFVITDLMDVLLHGFTGLAEWLHDACGARVSELQERIDESNRDGYIWDLCRGHITEEKFWEWFVNRRWTDNSGREIMLDYRVLLEAFRENMKKKIPGTLTIYRQLKEQYGIEFFIASDHVEGIVPLVIKWHPEIFEMIPKDKRFWSNDLGMVKKDEGLFPHVFQEIAKFGATPENTLFIDDSLKNIESFRLNGGGLHYLPFTTAEQLAKDLAEYGFEVAA